MMMAGTESVNRRDLRAARYRAPKKKPGSKSPA
jgi:hypothetical protein